MMKRWLVAGALALSINLWCVRDARADPVSTAIVTALSLTGTAAAVATFVINSALYAAGSWAVSKAAQALGLNKNAVQERQAAREAMTPEEKAAKAAKVAADLETRDKTQVPVLAGSIAPDAETITVAGESVKMLGTGQEWVLKDQAAVDKLRDRFPDIEFSVGDRVQFASFEAPEPSPEP